MMSSPDTVDDGLPARSAFRQMTAPPARRRSPYGRFKMAVRDYAGLGVFMAMLTACAIMVVLAAKG